MNYSVLFFCVLPLILVQHAKTLQVDTMDTWKTSISVLDPSSGNFSSGILKSHSGLSYTVGRNKTLYLSIPFGYGIMVSIRYIDLRPYNQDVLTLFSAEGRVSPVRFSNEASYKRKRYYPHEDLVYYVPRGNLGVTFSTGQSYVSYGYDGFELIYTVQGSSSQCKSRDFRCDNGRCIANILTCDGHNHCGDGSSERKCGIPGSGRVVGITFGCVFLLIAAACGIYVVIKRRRSFGTERQTVITSSHPPPATNQPVYPPVYPQPGTYYNQPPPPPPYSQGVTNPVYR